MTTPIQTLYDYLDNAGLLAEWVGPDNITQDEPTVQMRLLEEECVPSNERILLIKSVSSGGGSRFVSTPNYVFAVIGKVGESAVYAETYANLLYESLLSFEYDGCIISIDPLGAVNGAYKMASGRVAYDFEVSVNIDNGVI